MKTKANKFIEFHRTDEGLYAYDPRKEKPVNRPSSPGSVTNDPPSVAPKLVSDTEGNYFSSTDETERILRYDSTIRHVKRGA